MFICAIVYSKHVCKKQTSEPMDADQPEIEMHSKLHKIKFKK